MKTFATVVVLALASMQAFAGECRMTVTRVPCPGHEQESFSKCEGKKDTCDEVKRANNEAACVKEAERACYVFRPGVTKAKVVIAKFDGKELNGGKNFCEPAKPEFKYNTCK